MKNNIKGIVISDYNNSHMAGILIGLLYAVGHIDNKDALFGLLDALNLDAEDEQSILNKALSDNKQEVQHIKFGDFINKDEVIAIITMNINSSCLPLPIARVGEYFIVAKDNDTLSNEMFIRTKGQYGEPKK